MNGAAYSFHSNELPTIFCFLVFFVWHPVISSWVMIYFYECFRPCTHSRHKFMKKIRFEHCKLKWCLEICYFAQRCPSFVSPSLLAELAFLNTFSFRVFLSSFLFLENVKCSSKCSYCNAADHRRRARLYTKTWDEQRLIVDS